MQKSRNKQKGEERIFFFTQWRENIKIGHLVTNKAEKRRKCREDEEKRTKHT